jgi:hypothetical protein
MSWQAHQIPDRGYIRCTMKPMNAEGSEDKRTRRLLLFVALAALAIIATAFVKAASRVRVIPYSHSQWIIGKGRYTADNPRLKMSEEVRQRIWQATMDKSAVLAMIGERDDAISIKQPSGVVETPWGFASGHSVYVLGIQPKSVWNVRTIEFLTVQFDKRGRVTSAHIDSSDFPPGATIVPSTYGPKPPPPKKPTASKAP